LLIRGISLSNFRNYKNLQVDFHPAYNILIGENAQGKTNLLEAILYTVTGKSHRTNNDLDLITKGEKLFYINLSGERYAGSVKIEISARADGKKLLKVNNQTQKKLSELLGTINAVLFSPEDMLLVKGGPSIRRRFLDIEISQTSPFYCHNLANYNRVVSQRNNLLKAVRDQKESPELLDVWDMQLVEFGSHIIKKRAEVIQKIEPLARSIHRKITAGREELNLSYIPSVDVNKGTEGTSMEDYFLQRLKETRSMEIIKGITLLGPHRDDIDIKVGDTDIRVFGSQGQQRTSAISMKLSEIEFMKKETGEYPILLLDDVMSELDAGRRKFLLGAVKGKVQIFMTTTEIEEVYQPIENNSRIFEVKNGKIFLVQEG